MDRAETGAPRGRPTGDGSRQSLLDALQSPADGDARQARGVNRCDMPLRLRACIADPSIAAAGGADPTRLDTLSPTRSRSGGGPTPARPPARGDPTPPHPVQQQRRRLAAPLPGPIQHPTCLVSLPGPLTPKKIFRTAEGKGGEGGGGGRGEGRGQGKRRRGGRGPRGLSRWRFTREALDAHPLTQRVRRWMFTR